VDSIFALDAEVGESEPLKRRLSSCGAGVRCGAECLAVWDKTADHLDCRAFEKRQLSVLLLLWEDVEMVATTTGEGVADKSE
jgi:hypothetical protein